MNLKYTIILLFAFCAACIRPPEYPIEPVIEFKSLDKATMIQGNLSEDQVELSFTFTDGDGDIGLDEVGQGDFSIFAYDSRFGEEFKLATFVVPFVPEQGSGNGISGEISIIVYTVCCQQLADGSGGCNNIVPGYDTDTFSIMLYMVDRAGNRSNTISSDEITLLCQ